MEINRFTHKNIRGLSLYLCKMCDGPTPPCWDGELSGYVTCRDCYRSTGPKCRNCAVARVLDYLKTIDKRGYAPAFAVLGDVKVKGRIYDNETRKSCSRLPVKLVLPNGICFSTKTNSQGKFEIKIEAFQKNKKRLGSINIGPRPYHETGKHSFNIGCTLNKMPKKSRK